MKILISGFLPFSTHSENSSQIITERFKTHKIDGFEIHSVILPVTFNGAFECLKAEIDSFRPEAVVCLGLAGERKVVSLEQVAINFIHSKTPDNEGVMRTHELILKQGPNAYFSTLPLKKMLAIKSSYPLEISLSAGAYVCNYTMFQVLHYLQGSKVKGGFIHLPNLNDDEDKIFETVAALIKTIN